MSQINNKLAPKIAVIGSVRFKLSSYINLITFGTIKPTKPILPTVTIINAFVTDTSPIPTNNTR